MPLQDKKKKKNACAEYGCVKYTIGKCHVKEKETNIQKLRRFLIKSPDSLDE